MRYYTDRKLSFKEHSKELVTKSQELRRSLDGTMGGSDQIKDLCNQLKQLEDRVAQLETRPTPKGIAFHTKCQKYFWLKFVFLILQVS